MRFPKPIRMARNKYGAKRTTLPGEEKSFPSRLEATVYAHLKNLERAGAIRDLARYACVRLSDAKISYKPDARATYTDTGQEFWVEAKGAMTDRFRLITKLWQAYGPGPLEIYKSNGRGIYLAETIIPKGGLKKGGEA